MTTNNRQLKNITKSLRQGAKILFATFPADGHVNPLTGLAVHLKEQGYDVRWYTSPFYQTKIEKLGIPFYPVQKALDITGDTVTELFPQREKYKSPLSKLNFDIINAFILRGPEYYEDIKDIHKTFAFDLMIADVAFTGIPFVTGKMHIPVVGVGVFPITKNSKDLPPAGLAMTPSYNFFGRIRQNILRFAAKHILFAKSNKVMRRVFAQYDIECNSDSVFDLIPAKCNLLLQSGTPGFEYNRSDLDEKYKFVGPLLPFSSKKTTETWFDERVAAYKKVVLVTQGTVEKDSSKLLVPTLEALVNSEYLVIATTGGSDTDTLRKQYAAPNVIIEDFIPFADVMPYADVYVTNGGMGGVMLSIENKLPMVTAGVHEGKNEICARVGYFNLGINLKTERPTPAQIKHSIDAVTGNKMYSKNIQALSNEFGRYDPLHISTSYIDELLLQKGVLRKTPEPAFIY